MRRRVKIAVAGVSDFRYYDTKWAEALMKTEENKYGGICGGLVTEVC